MIDLHREFRENGVVCVRNALDERALGLAVQAFQWTLGHPGHGAREVLAGKPGAFYQDHSNPAAFPYYRPLLCETPLSQLVAGVIGSRNLWFLYEQIWLKDGGGRLATPWHQDLPYIPVEGDHLVTVWINLEPVRHEDSLEFVVKSHRGPLYNPTAFDPEDPSASMFDGGDWPSLPDVAATREQWPIVSWAIEPGDIVIFHMATLHGGAATRNGGRRRTISLRFFGDHAYCASRPETGLADIDQLRYDDGRNDPVKQMAHATPGSPFRHVAFHKVF